MADKYANQDSITKLTALAKEEFNKYLPLSGGTMTDKTMVGNLNAQYLQGKVPGKAADNLVVNIDTSLAYNDGWSSEENILRYVSGAGWSNEDLTLGGIYVGQGPGQYSEPCLVIGRRLCKHMLINQPSYYYGLVVNDRVTSIKTTFGNTSSLNKYETHTLATVEECEEVMNKFYADNDIEWVDMGEAGIWAACNVGATSPEEVGDYFAWGESKQDIKDKTDYSSSTYPYYLKEKYSTINNGHIELDQADMCTGKYFKIPKPSDFKKLYDLCDVELTTGKDISYLFKFTLKSDPSKVLTFRDCRAKKSGTTSLPGDYLTATQYWTRIASSSNTNLAKYVYFVSNKPGEDVIARVQEREKFIGFPIRGFIEKRPEKYALKDETPSLGIGEQSTVEGFENNAYGNYSHAEGYMTEAGTIHYLEYEDEFKDPEVVLGGSYSHAEGIQTKSIGNGSHAEGRATIAEGDYSHTEGNGNHAMGEASHTEGFSTLAEGDYSHTEGMYTVARGDNSHATGQLTYALRHNEFACGRYNTTKTGIDDGYSDEWWSRKNDNSIIFSVGNGTDINQFYMDGYSIGDVEGEVLSSFDGRGIYEGIETNGRLDRLGLTDMKAVWTHNAFEVRNNGQIAIVDTQKAREIDAHDYCAPTVCLQDRIGRILNLGSVDFRTFSQARSNVWKGSIAWDDDYMNFVKYHLDGNLTSNTDPTTYANVASTIKTRMAHWTSTLKTLGTVPPGISSFEFPGNRQEFFSNNIVLNGAELYIIFDFTSYLWNLIEGLDAKFVYSAFKLIVNLHPRNERGDHLGADAVLIRIPIT